MLALHAVLAAAALAGTAAAHPSHLSGNRHIQIRNTTPNPFKHGNLFMKRQEADDSFGSSSGEFPDSCTEQCKAYVAGGAKCAGLDDETQNVSQEDIMACACTADFMQATVTCMQCTPETFQTGDGYTAKTILSTALAQCECIGHKVEGIDISNVPGEDTGMGQSILDSCKSGGGTGIGNGQGTSETPSSDTASASASDSGGTLIQNDNNTVPAPFGVGSTASPTAKSAATGSAANANSVSPSSSTTGQSSTGAAYTIQVQHVLALLIAGFSSLVMF